jgi:hypothetical protein
MSMTLSLEDRFDIYDLFARYGWALDTGDAEGVIASFTPDAVVQVLETTFEARFTNVREWITNFYATNEGFRGRQHHMSQFLIEGGGHHARVRAFWLITKAETVTSKTRLIHNNGYYNNTLVKVDGRWLFSEVQIRSWNDQDLPWKGPVIAPGAKAYHAMAERRAGQDKDPA